MHQMCKLLISAHKADELPAFEQFECSAASGSTDKYRLVARCARMGADDVRYLCNDNIRSAEESRQRLRRCATLIEREVIPHAARWHRRDLSPLLVAAWRAVLRALAPTAAAAVGKQ